MRKALGTMLLAVMLLPGCHYPWQSWMSITPPETKAKASLKEEAVPTKRTTSKYRITIRPTSQPVVQEVPLD